MNEAAHIQDGTMKADAEDFWQLILNAVANRAYERDKMKWLAECLDTWFAAHPEITEDSPLVEHFAMCSVRRLVNVFVFNDRFGTDQPDFKERLLDTIVSSVGGPEALADKLADCDNDEKKGNPSFDA